MWGAVYWQLCDCSVQFSHAMLLSLYLWDQISVDDLHIKDYVPENLGLEFLESPFLLQFPIKSLCPSVLQKFMETSFTSHLIYSLLGLVEMVRLSEQDKCYQIHTMGSVKYSFFFLIAVQKKISEYWNERAKNDSSFVAKLRIKKTLSKMILFVTGMKC